MTNAEQQLGRRQFDYIIDRNRGSITARFLAKARAAGHLNILDYKHRWYVCRLRSRIIYRLSGDQGSQLSRKRNADARARAQLMALDHVIGNEGDHYHASEVDRVRFFEQVRGLSSGS